MATRSSYGQTWWGEQWLHALTQIDFDNRLPRGRSYANKGAVSHFEVRHGQIRAKVKGSQPRPYTIAIDVPEIAPALVVTLLDSLVQDLVIISRMLNRELDPMVLEQAKALKIEVFPRHWKDLSMRCSCPDFAVPCKHLAAVIYVLSREIDGNPFLVFSLRGIDLIEALKERNISIEFEANAALPTVAALFGAAFESQGSGPQLLPLAPPRDDTDDYTALDYSTLPNLGAALLAVLPANPTFYPYGDFRLMYDKIIKKVLKGARLTLQAAADGRHQTEGARALPNIRVTISAGAKPRIVLGMDYMPSLQGMDALEHWPQWMLALHQLSEADLPDLQPEVAALYHVRMFSLHLLAQGAVVPQVFDCGKSGAAVRWLPALLDATVHGMVSQLATLLPEGLASYRDGKTEVPLSGLAQAVLLCSLFLSEFMLDFSQAQLEKPFGNAIIDLFFCQGRRRFEGPGEGALKAGVQLWLSRFHLGRQPYSPVLMIEDGAFGFALSLAVEARAEPLAKPVPMVIVLQDAKWQASRYPVLQTVSLLAEFFPGLNAYVSAGAVTPIALSSEALPAFLYDTLPIIRLLGIRCLLPKALERVLRPRLSMKMSAKVKGPAFFKAGDVFAFDWTVAIGDMQVTPAEFEQLLASASGIVQFKGEYVYLDPLQIDKLRAQLQKSAQPGAAELLRIALAEEYLGTPVVLDEHARSLIRSLTEIRDLAQPLALKAALRPYQERGYGWLYRNIGAGFGSVIADDMGLGKTLQVIATLLKLKEEGALQDARALVIVPTSLLTNWMREIARFAPTLTAAVFHGSARTLVQEKNQERPDILLTTYGVARTDLAQLKKLAWRLVIVDEAQNIKNPAAAQTRAVKAIPAQAFVAMSGTPVENRLSELWSIMDFANRGMLGTLSSFTKEFAAPIQSEHDQAVLQRFRRVTAPFLLRRLKSDKTIISDLPDKIEQNQYCELSKEQSALYESVLQEALRVINGESDAFQRQGLVLQMIMALKQICNHPAHYLKKGNTDADLSGKVVRFLDLLDVIDASHEKVLVFTQFREMGQLLAVWIKQRFGREPKFLHGGVARKQRDEMVERFQNDRTERVFLLSLKAGGTGLNLTAASNVIHFDLWWNPAVEAQATDRAYRIGQQRNVQVHRLITRATFEEKINDMIQAKRDLAELSVATGEKWIGNLSNAELKDVFSLA